MKSVKQLAQHGNHRRREKDWYTEDDLTPAEYAEQMEKVSAYTERRCRLAREVWVRARRLGEFHPEISRIVQKGCEAEIAAAQNFLCVAQDRLYGWMPGGGEDQERE